MLFLNQIVHETNTAKFEQFQTAPSEGIHLQNEVLDIKNKQTEILLQNENLKLKLWLTNNPFKSRLKNTAPGPWLQVVKGKMAPTIAALSSKTKCEEERERQVKELNLQV